MKNKIAVIGNAFGDIDSNLKNKCYELGNWLSKNQFLVITGACPGIPYYVAKGTIENGGKVIGYTPATNIEEHCNKFNFPNDGFNELKFLNDDYGINEVYFRRSLDAIHEADIVISICGGKGTLSELFLATFFAKKIICANFSCGATKEFIDIHRNLKNENITYGEDLIIANDIEEIKREILNNINRNEVK